MISPVTRQLSTSLAIDSFGEKLLKDDAFPIIVIGKTPGNEEAEYRAYVPFQADSELVARTLLMVAVQTVGLDRIRDLVAEAIYRRRENDDDAR